MLSLATRLLLRLLLMLLLMLLMQAGRDREAAPVLRALDFTHRLARPVSYGFRLGFEDGVGVGVRKQQANEGQGLPVVGGRRSH